MLSLTLQLPEPVAAEFFDAADQLNRRFGPTEPRIEAKALMAFALARCDAGDVCAQFDLALRIVARREGLSNPVLK